jgi:hypothetical protein
MHPTLLWVRNNRHDEVRIVLDQKMEAPIAVHARLPEVRGLVVLLGVQRGMVEVLRQVICILVPRPSDFFLQRFGPGMPGPYTAHL